MLTLYASKKQEAGVAWNTDYHTDPTEITECNQYDFFRYDHTAILFTDGKRAGKNFVHATAIIIDIDNKETDDPEHWTTPASISEKLEILGIAHAIATSRNHELKKADESPRPRFHVYFPLSEPCDAEAYKKMTEHAINLFNADPATKDIARHFFGYGSNSHAIVYQRIGKYTFDEYYIHAVECQPPPKSIPRMPVHCPHEGKTPMEDYNERGRDHFKQTLRNHGWRYTGEEADNECWLRPGKGTHEKGKSATLHHTKPTFYIFSSSCALPAGQAYSLFRVYAHLEHGDDMKAAAKELASLGYGDPLTTAPVSLPGFITDTTSDKQKDDTIAVIPAPMPGRFDMFAVENHDELEQFDIDDPGLIPEDLLNPPGLVGEIARYCLETNSIPQQEFALATGIIMLAHLIGKNYRTSDNFRSNFYVMSIGESGAGKNRAIEFLLDTEIVQIDKKIKESFTSPPAINNYLRRKGNVLMVWDELGGKMEEMLKKPNSIFNQVLYCLTALYSAAGRSYFPDGKAADTEDTPIIQPHCCLYGTGTYESVFKTFEPKLIENGFIGRVNFFFADSCQKHRKLHEQPPIPTSILEAIKAWNAKPLILPLPQEPHQSLFQVIPEPNVVAYTEEAEQIFDRLTDHCENAQTKTPDNIKRLWVRTVQEAKKLALIYACSMSMENPSIDAEAATWACRLSEHLTLRKLHIAHYHMAENEQERLENDIVRYIKKQDKQRVTQSKLINRFTKGVPDYVRNNAIKNLLNTGQVIRETEITKGAKKPTTIYRISYKKD